MFASRGETDKCLLLKNAKKKNIHISNFIPTFSQRHFCFVSFVLFGPLHSERWVKLFKYVSHFLFVIFTFLMWVSTFPRTFDSCHGSSLTTPVILYDGSEEELMDTIEREFS